MQNYKLKKDYLHCEGYYRQKSKKDTIEALDEMLVSMIKNWNSVRRDSSYAEDDFMHQRIDVVRDCLYYLTGKEEYNNEVKVRQKLHDQHYLWNYKSATSDQDFEDLSEVMNEIHNTSFNKKMHKIKLKRRRANRVIFKEILYGGWALEHL